MKRTASDILRDALALPAEARAALAGQLLDSLDSHSEVRRRYFVQARRRALKRLRNGLDLQWAPAASRDELHRRLAALLSVHRQPAVNNIFLAVHRFRTADDLPVPHRITVSRYGCITRCTRSFVAIRFS